MEEVAGSTRDFTIPSHRGKLLTIVNYNQIVF